MNTENALKNIEELVRVAMANGMFKQFNDLDAIRMSVKVVADALKKVEAQKEPGK